MGQLNVQKVCLVAQVYSEVYFDENFATVIKPSTIRVVLSIVVINKWIIWKLIKNALNSFPKEIVSIEQTSDYTNSKTSQSCMPP